MRHHGQRRDGGRPAAPYIFNVVTPGNAVNFQRSDTSWYTGDVGNDDFDWVRLTYSASSGVLTAYYSTQAAGTPAASLAWTEIGTCSYTLPSVFDLGLMVTSHVDTNTPATAQFTSFNLANFGAGAYMDLTAPAAPANLSAAVTGSNNQISLTWSPVLEPTSGIAFYDIYRDGSQYLGSALSVSSLTCNSTTSLTTATLSSAAGLVVGQSVTVSGAAPSAYDGTFAITAISGNTFSYLVSGSPTSPASGTITVQPYVVSTTNSYADTSGISSQTQHSYQVAAVNYDGVQGALSLPVSVSPAGIASISAPGSSSILVAFTEPVDSVSSQQAGNYQVSGGISVTSAVLESDDRTVLLTTSATLGTSAHMLMASNIDTAAMSALPVSTGTFAYSPFTTPTTLPGPGYYAPFGPNGTWNYYEVVSTATTWESAEANAKLQTFGGKTGNLVTIRNATENTFLDSLIGGVEYWTGLTNSTAYGGTDYGSTSSDSAPAQGSVPTSNPLQQGAGFVWVDGESFTYHNWESGQPNNSSSGTTPANYVAAVAGAGTWDDRSDTNSSYPYAIEFNLGLTSPPDAGGLSVVEVQGSSALTSISSGISLINNPGSATVTNYTSALTSYYDPEDVAGNQHFTAFPFGGDTTAA